MTKSNGSFRLRALLALAGTAVLPAIALAQPANDNCATPTAATVGANAGTNVDATQDGNGLISCGVDDTYTEDVWFTFQAGAAGVYQFDTEGSVVLDDTSIEIFASCGGAELACDDDAGTGFLSLVNLEMTASQIVTIRVAGYGNGEGDFNLNIAYLGAPAGNDSCSSPEALSLGSATPGSTIGLLANGPQSTCAFFGLADGPDAFYSFTATTSGSYTFTLTPTDGLFDSVLVVGTDCTFATSVCADETGTDGLEAVTFSCTAGVPVLVRAAGWGGDTGTFEMTVAEAGPPAANDICDNAIALSLDVSANGDTTAAQNEGVTGSCTSGTNDLWYSFEAPADGTYVFTVDGPLGNSITLFGTCGGAEISCALSTGVVRNALAMLDGDVVRIRVAGFGSADNAFTIIAQVALPPENDDCETATSVNLSAPTTIAVDALAAGNDQPDVSCDLDTGDVSHGVWFTFNSGIDAGVLTVADTNFNDTVFALFTGSCGALTQVACSDPSPATFALSANTDYYLLVGMWNNAGVPDDLYGMSFSFVAATGACCNGTTCTINSASACATGSGSFVGGSCAPPAGSPVDFPGGTNLPLAITDNATGSTDVVVASTTPIGGVSVSITATHTFAGDLDITLTNGTVTGIVSQDQGGGGNLDGTYVFSDAGTQTLSQAVQVLGVIPPGTYRAADTAGNLISLNDTFFGATPNTTWTLTVADDAGGDVGEISAWTLSLDGQGAGACAPVGPTPCELADFNNVDGVTADDIFAFLDAWFAQNGVCMSPTVCTADINGVDDVTADDIFAFLDLWFTFNGTNPCP